MEAIASMTSFVKVLPCPDVPISTVGLICWKDNIESVRKQKVLFCVCMCLGVINRKIDRTFTASRRFLTGSCSWAHGFLKCWSESLRELTINPCISRIRRFIQRKTKKSTSWRWNWFVFNKPLSPPTKYSCALLLTGHLSVSKMVSSQ